MFLVLFVLLVQRAKYKVLSIGEFDDLSLETGHASSHDLIHQQQVGGNHGAAVDHLLLHSENLYLFRVGKYFY